MVVERIGKPIAEMFVQERRAGVPGAPERGVVMSSSGPGTGCSRSARGSVLAAETRELLRGTGSSRSTRPRRRHAPHRHVRRAAAASRGEPAGVPGAALDRAPLYARCRAGAETARRSPTRSSPRAACRELPGRRRRCRRRPGRRRTARPAGPREDAPLPSPGFGAPGAVGTAGQHARRPGGGR
ncbi:hypothetical protein HBB16_18790 [Pseudonocardia sp. MCCB 268]|nr:hypothetical protein [Pseudonocardia cytotoxica]